MKITLLTVGLALGSVTVLGLAGNYGAGLYYAAGHGTACADCHEMAADVAAVHGSPHYNATCTDCHAANARTKLRHLTRHLIARAPDGIRLRETDVRAMMTNCKRCHQHEFASWEAGPHSATYSDIFANTAHNNRRRLMDDCFRCHGMYFEGAIGDLVQPQNTSGPWHLTRPELATEPSIPCQSCHWIHKEGAPQSKSPTRASVAGTPVRDSLAFYDRREEMHFRAASLALPQLQDGPRAIKVSPDPRQGVCYQCHAPRQPDTGSMAATSHWGPQAGSGDDRTPMGVHEGLSCFSCHGGHNENARASCKTCHPAMSNCGLDVEKMDTSFADPKSKHNVHWVKCSDCHEHGVPKAKRAEPQRGE